MGGRIHLRNDLLMVGIWNPNSQPCSGVVKIGILLNSVDVFPKFGSTSLSFPTDLCQIGKSFIHCCCFRFGLFVIIVINAHCVGGEVLSREVARDLSENIRNEKG